MTDLRDYQFEILPVEDSLADGVVFGIGAAVSVNPTGFDSGEAEWLTQDSTNETRGARMFGRDVPAANTWSWAGHVDQEDESDALEALRVLRRAWSAPRPSGWEPGEVTTLRYRIDGRLRRVYGRPRRFSGSLTNSMLGGMIPVNMDFPLADHLHYDDALSSATLTWNGADNDGGFVLPTTLPIVTIPGSQTDGNIHVGGDHPTYPVIRINGPIVNPSVVTNDWELTIKDTIGADEYVEVDLRPWHLTVLRNGTASIAGKLGRRQWFSEMLLRPGYNAIAFRGSSTSGGASCSVSWRSAWTTI